MTSKVGPKGQVVVPNAMREHLGLHPGDIVDFVMEDGGVRIEPARHPSLGGRYAAGSTSERSSTS